MKGTVLDFSIQTNEGVISAENGQRYTFKGPEWKDDQIPRRGSQVDFAISNEVAVGVYPVVRAADGKNKLAAALLAFFLGIFGVHKFYLGYTAQGLIMLLVAVFGAIIIFPTAIIGVIAFIEFIIYLTKSEAEFEEIYVRGRRPWF